MDIILGLRCLQIFKWPPASFRLHPDTGYLSITHISAWIEIFLRITFINPTIEIGPIKKNLLATYPSHAIVLSSLPTGIPFVTH